MSRAHCLALLLALGTAAVTGCAATASRGSDSLYQAVGSEAGVERLVNQLLERVYADDRISGLFQNSDRADLQRLIEEQFCVEFGGPCSYSGRSMSESHGGLGIKHKEFEAFVEDLILAMEDLEMATTSQNRILAIFAPMRGDVVDK